MRKLYFYNVLVLAALAAAGARAEERTVDSVEAAVVPLWDNVHAFTANVAMEGTIPKGPIMVTSKGAGTVEVLRVDDKTRMRMEILNNLSSNLPLMGSGMQQKVLTVFNGEIVYNEIEMMGMKKYAKVVPKEADLDKPVGGKALFDSLRKRGEVTVMPDEQVNGQDVYVLKVKVTESNPSEPVKPDTIMAYIAKDSGIPVRTVSYNAAGSPVMTVNYTDIKINPELDPKRFEYTPPPGVEVIDLTKSVG